MCQTRNNTIDIFRLFFAFCVVCIHVPLLGAGKMIPVFRCAVPFFYMVSGYFLMSNNIELKLENNFKKWIKLWLKYFIIIGIVSILLHSFYKESIVFSRHDIIEILLYDGNTLSMDHIVINGESTGLYTIWFLLCGAYSFLFYYFYKRYLGNRFIMLIVIFIFLFGITLILEGFHVSRFVYLSIPYIGLGMLVRKYQNKVCGHNKMTKVMILALLCGTYLEFHFANLHGVSLETTILSPFLMFLVVLEMTKCNLQSKFAQQVASVGRSTTLEIYIYHRPVYALLLAITPPSQYYIYQNFGAIIVFIFTLSLVILCHKIISFIPINDHKR